MSAEQLKDMLYFCFLAGSALIVIVISLKISLARLRQKNYFLNRDRERYAETLYASKDGYFAFVYPDERIKDPRRTVRERCSRRLAVMLNLKGGTQSSFADVMEAFYKDDAKKITKYLALMQDEGVPFEDTFMLKNVNRSINIFGARINGTDSNLYCDMLWFRDLSEDMLTINRLEEDKKLLGEKVSNLENLINTLNIPLWLRDEKSNIIISNKKYNDIAGLEKPQSESPEGLSATAAIARELAQNAQAHNKAQHKSVNLVVNGESKHFELTETPYHRGNDLNRIGTAGALLDITELDEVKRTFAIHQNAHLEVLSALGTAFAIFNTRQKLIFHNKAFANMWNLSADFLDKSPSYSEFLDKIRENRLLEEVSDFRSYCRNEEKVFKDLIEPKEKLLHLPDGRTFRRMTAPHPNGLIFAFEDVSDRLAATRTVNEMVDVQQKILDNVDDAIIIFSSDQRLKYFNKKYQSLWRINAEKLQKSFFLSDVLEEQKIFFSNAANWENLKQGMMAQLINTCSRFALERADGIKVNVMPVTLPDESLMIRYVVN